MDTNKITGIIFELDKATYEERVKKGLSPNQASKQATQAILIFHEDTNNNEYVDVRSYADDAKITEINKTLMKAQQSGLSQSEIASYYSGNPILADAIDRAQGQKLYLPTAEREEETNKIIAREQSKAKKTGIKLGAAALAIAITAGLASCHNGKEKEKEAEIAIEEQIEMENWANYFASAEETLQKDLFVNSVAEWTTNINANETWEKVTLTDEEMKELGYESPECVFGFTAEEAHSLALRYNTYTKDQLVTISGGKEFDVTSLITSPDSISNKALTKIQTYYFNSEECNLDIDKLLTFTEAGNNKINELESLFREYKVLDKDEEKAETAKEKMAEIKHVLLECAYDTTFDKDAKSYILSTFLPTASRISEMHQYKDTIEIEVYDTKKDENTTKEIETALFDEITNRALRLGFDTTENVGSFDAESFLENHDVDSKRYNLLNVDIERSITDQLCGEQGEKLVEANEYIADLRSENHVSEVAYAGVQGADLSNTGTEASELNNVATTYDDLTQGTYDPTEIMDMLNNYLKEKGKYPSNVDYFSTKLVSKKIEEYKNTHGITAGKPGDIIKGPTRRGRVSGADLGSGIVYDENGNIISAEEAMAAARKKHEEETGIIDASTPEKDKEAEEKARESDEYKNRTALLQGVYDATYNYYYGKTVRSTSYSYDSSWASSSDAEIKSRHDTAKSQAQERKRLEEEAEKENKEQQNQDPDIDPGFDDAEKPEKPQNPEPTPEDPTPTPPAPENPEPTPENPTPENPEPGTPEQPGDDGDIELDPGFEDAEIIGDPVIGESAAVDTNSVYSITVEDIDNYIASMANQEENQVVKTK